MRAGIRYNFVSMKAVQWIGIAVIFMTSITGYAQETLNQTDNEGRKQGTWSKEYENGQERYRGQFKDDLPVGTFFYYYEDGGKSSEVQYEGGDGVRAKATFFHKNGAIMAEGYYENQKKVGTWKYYDDQTILSSVEEYKDGKLHGTSVVYFLNGQVAAEVPYVDGLKTGPFVEYFQDGTVRMKGTYQDNTYTGEYKQYYQGGQIMIEGQYKAAVKDGLWVYYADNGAIKAQQVYEKGKMVKEKIEEGFEPETVPIDIEEKDKIDEQQLIDEYYNRTTDGK